MSWDSGDAVTENRAAPVQAGQRVRRLRLLDLDILSGAGAGADTAEPVFGYYLLIPRPLAV